MNVVPEPDEPEAIGEKWECDPRNHSNEGSSFYDPRVSLNTKWDDFLTWGDTYSDEDQERIEAELLDEAIGILDYERTWRRGKRTAEGLIAQIIVTRAAQRLHADPLATFANCCLACGSPDNNHAADCGFAD